MARTLVISAEEPDWSRERGRRWSPGRSLLATIRGYARWQARRGPVPALMRRVFVVRHRFWSAVTSADIPLTTTIGGGLLLPHPAGIVIHPAARIGPNCLIFQNVTIGTAGEGAPTIGGHVDIGAGAVLLGPIVVGDHARIGANAVVTRDVPPHSVAIGVPARNRMLGA